MLVKLKHKNNIYLVKSMINLDCRLTTREISNEISIFLIMLKYFN